MGGIHDRSLRGYQLEIKREVLEAWDRHRSLMVQMPTGTGKTHLLASVIHDRLKEDGKRCVWIVAHRRELVEQIEETVARYGIPEGDGRVRVMSIQWLSRHWEEVRDERPGLIVIDEAHHALAGTYRELWLRHPEARKLGMTATPCRLNGRGFTDLFDALVASEGIADFIRQGWLSAFDYVSIRPDSEEQRLIDGLRKRGADGDFQVKEMDAALNRRPGIGRLYESVRQYAEGRKGIVYAVSIGHARNIAGYYRERGISAAAIDSGTPAGQRKQMVEEFRRGGIRVLVNVDVFSEGFDCPDVEFVQLARPTLSLAKYLQQVGRGLRKTSGKESCVLIDNVGLYRLFGLPTAYRDWQAMFEGRLAGKGCPAARTGTAACMAVTGAKDGTSGTDGPLETIVSHGQLMEYLRNGASLPGSDDGRPEVLRPFRDRQSGLWGLRQGRTVTATARYLTVFDVGDRLAAVKFKDYRAGIVEADGKVRMRLEGCRRARFLPDGIVSVEDNSGKTSYIDLKSGGLYEERPKVARFGAIELLKVGSRYCSRTRHVYRSLPGMSGLDIIRMGFYLRIHDILPRRREFRPVDDACPLPYRDCVCILENDGEDYYRLCGELADGSIVVADERGNYYHAEEGGGKRYIASEHPGSEEEAFDTVVPRLREEAETRAARMREESRREEERKRRNRLAGIRDAVPFRSRLKWGLKSGDRVIVPPVYRNIQKPVGRYCAVEVHPRQWGVIMLDGKVVVEARYSHVEIDGNGTARLTIIPGKTKTVDLKKN